MDGRAVGDRCRNGVERSEHAPVCAGREPGRALEEPPVLLGSNEGANPVEFLLHALAGCVTTTFVLHAMARGIVIEELSTELAGDLDLQGLLGLDDNVHPATSRSESACKSGQTAPTRS